MCRFEWDRISPIIDDNYPMTANLSAASQALLLAAVLFMSDRWRWGGVTDILWDEIDAAVSAAEDEIMNNAMLGAIIPVARPPSDNELLCDGTTYNRVDYPQLYEVLNAAFVLSVDTFFVPDMRNSVPVGASSTKIVGSSGGAEVVQLTSGQMPRHRHGYSDYTANPDLEGLGVPDPLAVGLPKIIGANTDYTGNNESHQNMPPYVALNYVMVAY